MTVGLVLAAVDAGGLLFDCVVERMAAKVVDVAMAEMARHAQDAALGLLGTGDSVLGGLGSLLGPATAPSVGADELRRAIREVLQGLEVTVVPVGELVALRAVARAAGGDGDMTDALKALEIAKSGAHP